MILKSKLKFIYVLYKKLIINSFILSLLYRMKIMLVVEFLYYTIQMDIGIAYKFSRNFIVYTSGY